jgi:hypothetical protein
MKKWLLLALALYSPCILAQDRVGHTPMTCVNPALVQKFVAERKLTIKHERPMVTYDKKNVTLQVWGNDSILMATMVWSPSKVCLIGPGALQEMKRLVESSP